MNKSHYFSRLTSHQKYKEDFKVLLFFSCSYNEESIFFVNLKSFYNPDKRWACWMTHRVERRPPTCFFSSNAFLCKRRHNGIQNPVISRVNPEYLQWVLMANKRSFSSLMIHTRQVPNNHWVNEWIDLVFQFLQQEKNAKTAYLF